MLGMLMSGTLMFWTFMFPGMLANSSLVCTASSFGFGTAIRLWSYSSAARHGGQIRSTRLVCRGSGAQRLTPSRAV